MVQALSDFQTKQTGYDAALKHLFDGAAHVAVPVPERHDPRGSRERTSDPGPGGAGLLPDDRPPAHGHRDAADGLPAAARPGARRRRAAAGAGRGLAGRRRHALLLNVVSEGLLHDMPGRRAAAEPDARGAGLHGRRPAARGGAGGAARARQHAAPQGPARRASCRARCCPASSIRSSTSPTTAARGADAPAARRAASASCSRACARRPRWRRASSAAPSAVLGWPIDEAGAARAAARRVAPDLQVIVELINRVDREEPIDRLEAVLKHDPTLAFRLVRYINSPAFGLRVEISSFRHAIMMLGYQKLKRWLALLLASASKDANMKPVMFAAVRRGLLMEELVRVVRRRGDAQRDVHLRRVLAARPHDGPALRPAAEEHPGAAGRVRGAGAGQRPLPPVPGAGARGRAASRCSTSARRPRR